MLNSAAATITMDAGQAVQTNFGALATGKSANARATATIPVNR